MSSSGSEDERFSKWLYIEFSDVINEVIITNYNLIKHIVYSSDPVYMLDSITQYLLDRREHRKM